MADDGTSVDGRDEDKACRYGALLEDRVGLDRRGSQRCCSISSLIVAVGWQRSFHSDDISYDRGALRDTFWTHGRIAGQNTWG